MSIIHSLHFNLGPGFWNEVPRDLISPVTDKFTTQARRALTESDIVEPSAEQFKLIVMAAVESVCLLHDAALDPSQADLDHHSSDFVVRAVTSSLSQ